MNINETEHQIREMRDFENMLDRKSDDFLLLLLPRLRKCSVWNLAPLKRELRKFNIHKSEWTDKDSP